jgi:hypothetical protein
MNWRKGFQRLWVALSGPWVLLMIWIHVGLDQSMIREYGLGG